MSYLLEYDENKPDPRPGDYFVSAIYGDKYALISGPYSSHEAALADVKTCRKICDKHDPRSHWWAFGTCRMDEGSGKVGTLQKHRLHEIIHAGA